MLPDQRKQKMSLKGVVFDTGFWIAAFDKKKDEGQHSVATKYLEKLRNDPILMPWPILYEVMRTRTVKNTLMMESFDRTIRKPKFLKIDDHKYRGDCVEVAFQTSRDGRPISLVDLVIRSVLEDSEYRITRLFTFNKGDFADVCRNRGIEMLSK
jgi:predicted nucleic acid-binding protein